MPQRMRALLQPEGCAPHGTVAALECALGRLPGQQKPALGLAGQGGWKEGCLAGYFVASASAGGSGTTAERIPILAQMK